jgi:hypothetical protein
MTRNEAYAFTAALLQSTGSSQRGPVNGEWSYSPGKSINAGSRTLCRGMRHTTFFSTNLRSPQERQDYWSCVSRFASSVGNCLATASSMSPTSIMSRKWTRS